MYSEFGASLPASAIARNASKDVEMLRGSELLVGPSLLISAVCCVTLSLSGRPQPVLEISARGLVAEAEDWVLVERSGVVKDEDPVSAGNLGVQAFEDDPCRDDTKEATQKLINASEESQVLLRVSICEGCR
jgi:hypothetical protein